MKKLSIYLLFLLCIGLSSSLRAQCDSTITGGGVTVCSGTTVNLSVPSGAVSYQWDFRLATESPTIIGDSSSLAVTSSGIYTVTITGANGCISTNRTIVNAADYVFNGSLGAGDAQQTGRINRFGVVSTCAAPKACPGLFTATGSRYYDSYTVTNTQSSAVCATIGVNSNCGTSVFSLAYLGSFVPTALCTNYMGDPGSSFPVGGFYQVTIPAGSSIVVVVHEVNPGTGCGSYSLTVDIPREAPGIAVVPNDTICAGTPVSLTASHADSYLWSPDGETTQAINFYAITSNTYSVNLGYGNYGCTASLSVDLSVGLLPTPTIGANPNPVCSGGTLNLTAGGGATYAWAGPNTFSSTLQNPQITNIQTTQAGLYTLTVTSAQGCTAFASINVTVNTTPTPTIGASPNPICSGNTLSLTSGGGSTYAWSGPNTFSSTLQNPQITNIQTTQGGLYTVTVTSAQGCTATSTINVTVNQTPTPTIGATPNPICSGNTLSLTSSGGGTYAWSGPNTFSSTLQNPQITNIQPTQAGVYMVTVTSAQGCTALSSLNVTVNPTPTPTIGATPNPICSGNTLSLTSGGGSTYAWSGPNTFSSTLQNPQIANIQTNQGGLYTVTVTSAQGCTATSTINVTVNQTPTPTIGATPNPICSGNTLSLTSGGGSTYAWSGPNTFSSTLQNPQIANIQTNQGGLYTVTVTSAQGCTATSTINVTVNQTPTPTIGATPNPICSGNTLSLTSGGGSTYAWSGPNTFSSTLQNPQIANIQTNQGGLYTVTVTSVEGCSATATVNVTVNLTPTPTIGATPNPICSGATLSLTSGGGSTYAWSGPNTFSSTLQNPQITSIQTTQTGIYTVTVTSAEGCTATASVSVTVNQTPAPTIGATPNPICTGNTLSLTTSGGATYNWTGPNSFASTLQNPQITNIQTAASGVYAVTVTSAQGCTSSASVNVTVNLTPTATASGTPNPICTGNTLQLNSSGGATYNWSGPNSYSTTVQNPSLAIVGTNQGGVYTVTVTSAQGCTATATVNITVNPTPTPTATATPNPLCAGGTLQLTATGGGTYAWSGPAGFTSTLSNPTRPNALTTYSGVYRVTVTSTAGCTAIATANAVVNPLPVVTISAVTNPVCSGQTVILYANGASGYTWSTGATTSTITVVATTNTTYTVTGTSGGCSGTASFVLSVNPSPTISVNPANIEICVNDTITLSGAGGTKYVWSTGETTNTIKVHPREATTYTVTGTAANGCTGKATSTVTVKDFEAGVTVSKAAICEGETVTLTATGGTAYSWTPGNASGSTINVRPTVSTTYRVRITGANGCIKYLEVYIEVYPKPIIFINDVKSTVPPPICPGTEVDLRAGGAYSYLWTPDSIPGRIITVAPKTTTRYTVTGSNIWGCTSTASINIPVFAPTSARIESSAGKDPICKGKELTLTVVGLTKPVWWPGKQTTNSITVVPKDIVYAEVTGFDANGCQVTLVFEARTIFCKDPGLVNPDNRSLTTNAAVISPNPMGHEATIRFESPLSETVRMNIFSVDGRLVKSIVLGEGTATYQLERGSLENGVFMYQMTSASGLMLQAGKLVLIKD